MKIYKWWETAEHAAETLRLCGYQVDIVDGDWGCCYFADDEAEHDAIRSLDGW